VRAGSDAPAPQPLGEPEQWNSTSSGGVLGSNPNPNHDPDPNPNVRLGHLALGCLCVTH
jgi:hypothetical protein